MRFTSGAKVRIKGKIDSCGNDKVCFQWKLTDIEILDIKRGEVMEHIEIAKEIIRVSKRLEKSGDALFAVADKKATKERDYRQELAKQILKRKDEGFPATIVGDIARGDVAQLKYERDLSADMFKASIEGGGALKTVASMLQTVHKKYDSL